MMITEALNAKLNEQIATEFAAAHGYLAMACSFEAMGLKFLAKRFLQQNDEEREHAMKVLRYIQQVGGSVRLSATPKPPQDYDAVDAVVRAALESELEVTKKINELVDLAISDNDHATKSFLQWFVDEQVEEVASMRELLGLVEMAGKNLLQIEARVRHEMVGG